MGERDPLFSAVLADPCDDTVRLAYADYLDEQPTTCMACTDHTGFCWGKVAGCRTCGGTGIDTADADRAELIRLHLKMEEIRRECLCGSCVKLRGGGQHHNGPCACDRRTDDGTNPRRRERELLDRHPEWLRDLKMPCPEIRDPRRDLNDRMEYRPHWDCGTCGGTGDLLRAWEADGVDTHGTRYIESNHRNPTLTRGLTLTVECRLDEVVREEKCPECSGAGVVNIETPYDSLEWDTGVTTVERACKKCGGDRRKDRDGSGRVWQPTPWALAFWRACVGMGRVPWWRVTDREPHVYGDYCYFYEEERSSGVRQVGRGYIPGFLLDAMVKAGYWFDYKNGGSSLRTPEAARHALELAVYFFVLGKTTTPASPQIPPSPEPT